MRCADCNGQHQGAARSGLTCLATARCSSAHADGLKYPCGVSYSLTVRSHAGWALQ